MGLSDTWTWDGSAWKELDVAGPSKRLDAVLAPFDGKLVLFGGSDAVGGSILADTWTWDGAAWTKVSTSGPSALFSAVMATP
jgi:hypothetical protein